MSAETEPHELERAGVAGGPMMRPGIRRHAAAGLIGRKTGHGVYSYR